MGEPHSIDRIPHTRRSHENPLDRLDSAGAARRNHLPVASDSLRKGAKRRMPERICIAAFPFICNNLHNSDGGALLSKVARFYCEQRRFGWWPLSWRNPRARERELLFSFFFLFFRASSPHEFHGRSSMRVKFRRIIAWRRRKKLGRKKSLVTARTLPVRKRIIYVNTKKQGLSDRSGLFFFFKIMRTDNV